MIARTSIWLVTALAIVVACSTTDTPEVADSAVAPNTAIASGAPRTSVVSLAPSATESSAVATTGPSASVDTASCRTYRPQDRGTLPASVTELSGWALSRRHRDVLWGHNDSGEGPTLIAISAIDGSQRGAVTLEGATADDWEDVATYTDPAGRHWIIVADTGDNAERRDEVHLVIVEEPELSMSAVAVAGVVTVEWANGPHDVEALIVDPITGDAIVIGKRFDGASTVSVDRIPADAIDPGSSVTSQHVGDFVVPDGEPYGPTGASIDASGSTLAMVFYGDETLVWRRTPGADVAETILGSEPCTVATGLGQFESIAIADDGTLFVATEGTSVPLWAFVPAP